MATKLEASLFRIDFTEKRERGGNFVNPEHQYYSANLSINVVAPKLEDAIETFRAAHPTGVLHAVVRTTRNSGEILIHGDA